MNARELVERYKASGNEEVRGGYGRELLGTIIGFAIPGSRRALSEKLESEATTACTRTHQRARTHSLRVTHACTVCVCVCVCHARRSQPARRQDAAL